MVTLNTERNTRILELLLTYGSIPFWGIVLFYAYSQLMPRGQYGVLFLGAVLLLYIINELRDVFEEEDVLSLVVLLACVAVIVPVTAYMFSNFTLLDQVQRGRATTYQLYGALAFTLVMIYLTWRAFGITFLVVVLAGIAYGLFGEWVPGVLGHGGISWDRMLRLLVIEVEGFFGFLNRLTAAWIAPFLLYAGLLKGYGAFQLILRLAVRSAKYVSSGVAQTAVIASAVIGSVNGSQTANAGMTGSFTIPMMKENGVKPKTAGAIEAVASTSGQVLPPVMGAGAFIMASLILGVTYFDVILSGLIPAVILVVSVVIAVHYVAAPQIDDPTMDDYFDDSLSSKQMAIDTFKFALPLILLVWLLGFAGYTIMTGALVTATSMIVLGISVPVLQHAAETGTRGLGAEVLDVLRDTREGFREGAIVLAPVAIILAAINGVVDILQATGTPTSVSLALMDLSGGTLIIAAVLGMIICILLGLGMPTTAAYTIVALLVAPTFVTDFAQPELSAHFFVFYAAILAGLTPPIATCVAVATGIAGSDFWATCAEAIKISAPLFLLPFAFLYHPEMVAGEFTSMAIFTGAVALFGAIVVIHGLAYRFTFSTPVNVGMRSGFFVLGTVAMIHPDHMIRLGALGLALGLFLVQSTAGKPTPFQALRTIKAGISGLR